MSDVLRLSAPIEIQAAAAEKPARISILAYSGGLMRIPGWNNVVVDTAGLDVSASVQLLVDHNASLQGLVGTGEASVRGGKVYVDGILSRASDAALKLIAMSKDGLKFEASVGVEPTAKRFVRAGESVTVNGQTITAGGEGFVLVTAGRLKEVSIVPLGADQSTSVSIAASSRKGKTQMPNTNMTDEEIRDVEIPGELQPVWDREGLTPSQRILARWNAAEFSDPNIRRQVEPLMVRAAAGDMDFTAFENKLLQAQLRDRDLSEFKTGLPRGPEVRGSSHDTNLMAAAEAALLCHLGAEHVAAKQLGDRATQAGRDLKATSLVEILQAAWQATGMTAPRGRDELIKASFSTAAIANVVSNVQNKMLLDQWERLPLLSLKLAKQVSAKDFKQATAVRLGVRDVAFDELGAGGEIHHGWLSDDAATYQLATYARMYSVTRQSIINDDLGAFADLPAAIARGAGLKLESLFWSMVLGNSGSFFAGGNNNYLTTALGTTGLAAGVKIARNMVDADGEPLLMTPKFLVVPPTLETTADTLYASTNLMVTGTTDVEKPDGNPFKGKYEPVVSPYLENENYTGYSSTAWYLFADPNAGGPAAFLVAFLNNQTRPVIEQEDVSFERLGTQFRGYLDMAVAQLDTQGAVFSTGAGE